MTCSTSSGPTSARSSAAVIAVPPSLIALSDESAPPIFPNGVRAVERMTERDIWAFLRRAAEAAGRHRMLDKLAPVQVEVSSKGLGELEADVYVVGLAEGDDLPAELRDAPGTDDVKAGFKKMTMLRPASGGRWLVAGLGDTSELDRE